jgi:hypothetical protein
VAGGRVGAGQALPDTWFWLAAARAQPLRAHLLRHGHVDHDEPPVARVELVDHAAGDVGITRFVAGRVELDVGHVSLELDEPA